MADTRKHYIDNLRGLVLLILVPYHTAQAWNCWGEPNYIFFESNERISSFIVFFSPYFMPLLFVLAGISTKYALNKRTNKEYLIERVKKLLVPMLFGTIVLVPVMTYLADRFNYSYKGGFLEHYAVFFSKCTDWTGADGGFNFGQFWFLLYLMVISIVGVGLINLLNKIRINTGKGLSFGIVLLMGLPLPILSELLSIGGKSLVEYAYLFLLGYYVFTEESILKTIEKNCILLLVIGVIVSVWNVYLYIWAKTDLILLNTITKYISEWIMIIALIGFAKRYLNRNGKATTYLNKRAFLLYIYHFIWVVSFQYILSSFVENNTAVLFIATVLLSYAMTFISCEISIRIPALCFLTGTKYRSNK